MNRTNHKKPCNNLGCLECQPNSDKKKQVFLVEEMKSKLIQLVNEKPEKAAYILSTWIKNNSK